MPAPKQKTVDQVKSVSIADVPYWACEAFSGNLNRIQSVLYPVAFGQDDPILLCAPTGAGKVSRAMQFFS